MPNPPNPPNPTTNRDPTNRDPDPDPDPTPKDEPEGEGDRIAIAIAKTRKSIKRTRACLWWENAGTRGLPGRFYILQEDASDFRPRPPGDTTLGRKGRAFYADGSFDGATLRQTWASGGRAAESAYLLYTGLKWDYDQHGTVVLWPQLKTFKVKLASRSRLCQCWTRRRVWSFLLLLLVRGSVERWKKRYNIVTKTL